MNVDAYRLALSEAGKLKLRASALLAEGGRERMIDAAALFQAAARAEARSLLALERVPVEPRLAATIEECWCLLEGGDPASAALAWDRVRVASEQVPPEVASSMRSRLDPVYAARTRAYAMAIQSCKMLTALRPTGSFVPPTKGQRALLDRELSRLLRDFPGVASFWWAKYRLAGELAAGREATVDILYRAGLGDLAASTPPARKLDLGQLLEQRVQTEIEADERLVA